MQREKYLKNIKSARKEEIIGKLIALRPLKADDSGKVYSMRNKPRNRNAFGLSEEMTLGEQENFFIRYSESNDDIYWCVYRKSDERFIGTIRLYKIDVDKHICDEGSFMIDEDVTYEAPYGIEAKLLVFDTAFGSLGIKEMYNDCKADNKVMNSIDDHLGFNEGHMVIFREKDFRRRMLTSDEYYKNRDKLVTLIDYWGDR